MVATAAKRKTGTTGSRTGGTVTAPTATAAAWKIKLCTSNGEMYNGNYTAGDARKAKAKGQTIMNMIDSGKAVRGFIFTWDGPDLPAPVKRSG